MHCMFWPVLAKVFFSPHLWQIGFKECIYELLNAFMQWCTFILEHFIELKLLICLQFKLASCWCTKPRAKHANNRTLWIFNFYWLIRINTDILIFSNPYWGIIWILGTQGPDIHSLWKADLHRFLRIFRHPCSRHKFI